MTTSAIEIQGTLLEDGTVLLDQKPDLPPGRVKVMMQRADPTDGDANGVISVLERIHASQALRGHVARSVEEIDTYLAEMRDDDERSRMIERIQEECRRQREGQPTAEAG